MDRNSVENILGRMTTARVLVIGDLILDKYIWGRVGRISPEAPVPVVEVEREEVRLGGAGNVVNNLLSLGCQVSLASVVGADADGRELVSFLQQQGLDTSSVQEIKHRRTSCKTRILANYQQMLRVDRESVEPVSSAEQDELFADVVSLLPDVHAVLISDYLKGALTPELLQRIIAVCRERQLPVIVDPKGNDFSRYRGATALTPNRREAEIATGISITDEDTLLTAGDRLLRQLQLDAVILTRSEEGISLFTAQGSIAHFPTEAREVFDVSGAGDTVVATIGAALAVGLSLADAVKLSNLAAGIVVGKLGTSTVTPAEIFNLVLRRSRLTESKILSARHLQAALEPLRSAGKQIVFTNGCFDLLHAGHVKYLQQARQLGDLLVLGLNSDASIRRLKGEKRPLLEETERAQILAALDCIDYLIIFDEDTPLDLLQLVRPDILVKGGDYSVDQVVGKDLVESYGGRVELIQFVEGKSTTNIVEKIIQRYGDDGSQRGE